MLVASIRNCEANGHRRESPEWWGVLVDAVRSISRGLVRRYNLPAILWDDFESDLLIIVTQIDWSKDDKQINSWLTMRLYGAAEDVRRRWYHTRLVGQEPGRTTQIVSLDASLDGIFDRFINTPHGPDDEVMLSHVLDGLPLPISHWVEKRLSGHTWKDIAREANVATTTCITQCRRALASLAEPAEVD